MICSRCGKDLTDAVNLLGYDAVVMMHRHAHTREDAIELEAALRDLTRRCDGQEGVRADGSNIDTQMANALLARLDEKPRD